MRGGTGPGDGRHRERGPCRPPGESCAALSHGSSIPRRRRGDCGLVAALQAGGGWGGGEGGCIRVYLRLFGDDDACFGLGFFVRGFGGVFIFPLNAGCAGGGCGVVVVFPSVLCVCKAEC